MGQRTDCEHIFWCFPHLIQEKNIFALYAKFFAQHAKFFASQIYITPRQSASTLSNPSQLKAVSVTLEQSAYLHAVVIIFLKRHRFAKKKPKKVFPRFKIWRTEWWTDGTMDQKSGSELVFRSYQHLVQEKDFFAQHAKFFAQHAKFFALPVSITLKQSSSPLCS